MSETVDAGPAREVALAYRKKAMRRRLCRQCACRWWPLAGPADVGDGPVLTLCLVCGDVRSLRAVFG